jgi:hypothetical protein
MPVSAGWLCLCLVFAASSSSAVVEDPATAQVGQSRGHGQETAWQGRADQREERAHLSLAAACVENGDPAGAARHLAQYLAAFPEHHVVRVHYAGLLLRLHRPQEARVQFERLLDDVQDDTDPAAKHLIHCHRRLMEIAEEEGDDYAEHLHRGIGLYLLACERAGLSDPEDGELSAESVLCKAAGELTMAHMMRRDEARPCWYLYAVWSRLNQRQPALRHLREAESVAPFSDLTPAERRDLAIACLGRDAELRRR